MEEAIRGGGLDDDGWCSCWTRRRRLGVRRLEAAAAAKARGSCLVCSCCSRRGKLGTFRSFSRGGAAKGGAAGGGPDRRRRRRGSVVLDGEVLSSWGGGAGGGAEGEEEEDVSVVERKYEDTVYLVDEKTGEVVSEAGTVLGAWVDNAPRLLAAAAP